MHVRSNSRVRTVILIVGWGLVSVGFVFAAVILAAGKLIGDKIWAARGYPLDIGPELFFWGNRGLITAFVLCVAGSEMLLALRPRRRSGAADATSAEAEKHTDQTDKH